MSTETDSTSVFGVGSPLDWTIGGTLGGALGSLAFGVLIWVFDPEIVAVAIPGIYGLDPVGVAGWAIHIAHGAVLGLVFGFLVTRRPILGIIRMGSETDAISRTGMWLRVTGAGFTFALAVWAILPVLVLPVWIDMIGTEAASDFPFAAVESLLGHLAFGIVLGLVFASTVDLRGRVAEPPFED